MWGSLRLVPIKNLGEATHSKMNKAFLDTKGYSDQATVIASGVDLVASLQSLASARQNTFNEYF